MIILGINFCHDASVTLIKNGRLLGAIEEEKVSRIKQDFGWPRLAVDRFLIEYGIQKNEVDIVAFGSCFNESMQPGEIKYYFSKSTTNRYVDIGNRILAYSRLKSSAIDVQKNEKLFGKLLQKEGFANSKVEFYNHHLCHAASAYYASPIDIDLVITCDGQGDGDSFNFYQINDKGIELIKALDHTVSLGQFYGAITQLLDFKPTRHEGKITGLAAYGKHTDLVDKFYNLWFYENENLRRYPYGKTDQEFMRLGLDKELPFKTKINIKVSQDNIGNLYHRNYYILLQWLKETTKKHNKQDIAFACQNVTEQIVKEQVKMVISQYFGSRKVNIALAGGVFSNVRVNQELYELEAVNNIFVQPAMGDSGIGMGAAFLSAISKHSFNPRERAFSFSHTYLGPNYDNEIEQFLYKATANPQLVVTKMDKPALFVAQKLASNCIVGFWEGRMEWGPRALGARTIMLNTFDRSVNDSLNMRLNRTEFMPFAPVVLDYKARTYFPNYQSHVPAADYMTITYNTAEQFKEQLQAVVHVDGTARPQVIRREINSYYYDIIHEFDKITGCGAIVNTSFNAHEEPIVSTPEVSLKALLTNRIDAFVIKDYFIELKN
jgi:carbamoyltransferase